MPSSIELTLEQQFSLRSFETRVEQMDLNQARLALNQLYRELIEQELTYKQLLKEQWGMV